MSNRAACNCGSKEIERSAVTQMKHSHLQQVVAWMQSFKRIGAVHRVSNNVIKIVFDRDDTLYFNMQRSHATIFTCNKEIARAKIFQAPFDVMLAKRFERSHIERITLHNNDKIMRIKVSQKGTYKASSSLLQLEFTGKYTNAIIMDDKGVVAEALRHIDESVSCRTVKVGERLEDPPLPNYVPKAYPLEDVRTFLDENYRKEQSKKLSALKQQKLNILQQRLDVLQRHYDALKSEVVLQNKAAEYRHIGHLIIAEHIVSNTNLNEVWFVVSPQSPFKKKKNLLSEYNRLHLVNLAIEDNDKLKATDIEFKLPQPSYTIDTLVYLKEKYKNHEFSLIMGSDNLENLHKWKNAEILFKDYEFFVYKRPNHLNLKNADKAKVSFLDAPMLNISSTFIRKNIKEGISVKYILHEKVLKEIEEMTWYKS